METETGALTFRPVRPEEAQALRGLAHMSEAYWGYSPEFMDIFDRDFNIRPAFIAAHPVYGAWADGAPVAFWGLAEEGGAWELEYFYVDAQALGRGYGHQMWAHLTDWCRQNGVSSFELVTSPQAVGFYRRMGAVQDRQVPSTIDGRPIPHFIYQVTA